MGILAQYIQEQAENKKMSVNEWMEKRISEIPACTVGTHMGKFAHPDVKISLWDKSAAQHRGYITTAEVLPPWDIAVNAAYMSTAKLLQQELSDKKTVLFHMMQQDGTVEGEFREAGLDGTLYLKFQAAVRTLTEEKRCSETDDRLKQVYFPVDSGEYHVLTIMPASGVLLALKERIRTIDVVRSRCKDKSNELYGSDHDELWDTTEISFGGTKPQNISYLNNAGGGTAYLLPSLPPTIEKRQVRLPVKDFWNESLFYRQYEYIFRQLQQLFLEERNNKTVRNKIKDCVQDVLDEIMAVSYAVRNEPDGWSDGERFSRLPQSQKIWLDTQYLPMWKDTVWRDDISEEFARWMIRMYEQLLKHEHIVLGDGELQFFKSECRDVLDEVVSYTV